MLEAIFISVVFVRLVRAGSSSYLSCSNTSTALQGSGFGRRIGGTAPLMARLNMGFDGTCITGRHNYGRLQRDMLQKHLPYSTPMRANFTDHLTRRLIRSLGEQAAGVSGLQGFEAVFCPCTSR